MKDYAADAQEVEESAVLVAHIADHRAALQELALLFRRCGILAAAYADPDRVAQMLVQDVTETYRAERWKIRNAGRMPAAA
ncbi:hypothetical protein [Kitasatospora cineracea]|uniref:hypothetical protein n=1 Tax=Kitasatospora cineracea TaxID=88074 RepID=UPI00380D098F